MMNTEAPRTLSTFFLLTFLVTLPIWIIAVLTKHMIPEGLPVNNIGFLAVIAPITSALILSYREGGFNFAKKLLKRAVDYKKIINKVWLGQMVFLFLFLYLVSYGILNLIGGQILEITVPFVIVPLMFLIIILFAVFEEAGWMGYVFDSMEKRWSTLNASIILGLIMFMWHFPLYVLQNPPGGLFWIAGQSVNIVILRILIVNIYNKTGKSVFSAIILHAVSNLCTMIFPLSPIVSTTVTAIVVSIIKIKQ